MIKYLLLLVIHVLSLVSNIQGQEYLRILGRNHYNRCADYFKMKIEFNNYTKKTLKNTCYIFLTNNLQTEKIDTSDQNRIVIQLRDINEVYLADSLVKDLNLKSSLFYLYDQNKYEYQDKLAIGAIKDANIKAEYFAKVFGKKIDKIINVDDVVEKYLFNEDLKPETECEKNILTLLMEYFSEPEDPGKTEFETPCISGQYAVWVTYKLK